MAARKIYLPFGDAVVSWRDVTYAKVGNCGRGGSSDVYLALATSGPRRGVLFAVKMFSAVAREDWRLNFMREVHVLRDCDHPAIVRVFDEGVYRDQYPFFVMEYLPETLSKVMRTGELDDRAKLSIVLQLLSALNYLSRRDPPVVHRDIKPSNIFLKTGSCILGDFGLILQVDDSRLGEAKTEVVGKVPEMAKNYRTPELVAYHNGGPKPPPSSDVFQLGLVAAELFTRENPLLPDSPEKPLNMQPLANVPSPLGVQIKSLLDRMLIQEAIARPSVADLLSAWQDLFLAQCKRDHDERQTARMRTATQEAPHATAAREQPLDPPGHEFGAGIFDDE
jgi:serine/threonine protein kinase